MIPFGTGSFGQFTPNLGSKNVFLLNFTRILWILWELGLTLLYISKDAVFAEILVLSNIFGFPAVNWVPKWTKTVNFRCVPFETKFKFKKDFSSTVFVLFETTSGQSFSKIKQYLGGVNAQQISNRGHFMNAESIQKSFKFLISQPHMLYW